MTLSTSIFLSAILMSVSITFAATKDRWNWSKIIFQTTFIGVSILLLVAGTMWGGAYVHRWHTDRVAPVKEYWGIKLGATKEDVLFSKGEPIANGKYGRKNDFWGYGRTDEPDYAVVFSTGGKLTAVMCFMGPSCPVLAGIAFGESSDNVIKRLGRPTTTTTGPKGLSRFYTFTNLNAGFNLAQDKVTYMGMSSD